MSNLREVNDDILKDWLDLERMLLLVLLVQKIRDILFVLRRFLKEFWGMFLDRIKSMLKDS